MVGIGKSSFSSFKLPSKTWKKLHQEIASENLRLEIKTQFSIKNLIRCLMITETPLPCDTHYQFSIKSLLSKK